MIFNIEITDRAASEALETYVFILQRSEIQADRWFDGLYRAVQSLERHPARCSLAPESESLGSQLRQYPYKSHRILFTIEGRTVRIHHVRHAARDELQP